MELTRIVLLVGFTVFTVACSQPPSPEAQTTAVSPALSQPEPAASEPAMPEPNQAAADESAASEPVFAPGTHLDHEPKHGGTFFMALDNRHHLEGVLLRPGRFLIYLYDAHTQPVSPAELQQTSGTVQWGAAEDAPQTPLAVAEGGDYLEATPPDGVRLPLELTLRMHLPGMAPDARPELFTFPFSHYSNGPMMPMAEPHAAPDQHEHMH